MIATKRLSLQTVVLGDSDLSIILYTEPMKVRLCFCLFSSMCCCAVFLVSNDFVLKSKFENACHELTSIVLIKILIEFCIYKNICIKLNNRNRQ